MSSKASSGILKSILFLLPILLVLPALLINLDLMPFIDDEGIRSLVAYEMLLSGNYITPTLNGEFYYRKPPLFNWIIATLFHFTGQIGEFIPRLITVLMLLLYGTTVWYYYRKYFDRLTSFLVVFSLITCGRVLFWDSFLGLIDIFFSWVIFTLFMVVYHRYQAGQLKRMYIEAYLLAAIAFLLKGFPSIVFVGITIFTILFYRLGWPNTVEKRKVFFGQFFHPFHFVGGFLFLFIVGGYYFTYYQYNPSLENVFSILWDQSSQRTVAKHGVLSTFLSFFTFPFEMTYHFLPWSLLIVLALIPKYFRQLQAHDFLWFNVVCFLANVFIYWTSPGVYPRYLLMFPPLVFGPCLYLYQLHKKDNTIFYRGVDLILGVLCVGLTIGTFIPHFWERVQVVPYAQWKAFGLTILMVPMLFIFIRKQDLRLLTLISFLLLARIGFNWFVVPDRVSEDPKTPIRTNALEIGSTYDNLYLYRNTQLAIKHSFYLTKGAGKIIPRRKEAFDPQHYYIMDVAHYSSEQFEKLRPMDYIQKDNRELWIVKMKD